ncbi:putative transcription factor OFP family [Dioscorea sansibarensis]
MGRNKSLKKSIRIYFSKLKKPIPNSGGASKLLSLCKYPKTPSFAVDRDLSDERDQAATLSDIDRFLYENFHSLYAGGGASESSSESPRFTDPLPDSIRSSGRFFVFPGASNSLVEEARLSAASSLSEQGPVVPGGGVAVMTFSKDPYDDFRRSMQDMVNARHVEPEQPLDWDFMEEMLFCFLELNDRTVHKYILRAFTDLTVSFRRKAPVRRLEVPAARRRTVRKREGM